MRASMLPAGVRRHIMESSSKELMTYMRQRDRINDEFLYSQAEILCRILTRLEETEIDGGDRPKDRKVPARKQTGSGKQT